ncbi:Crp/Fnr family transcriptional regulator [Methylopila musalis]|uniref:Crp/Fnr family transcriptional regulator n=1 Tax=Methylopila musalis TaxID=1134781 RepID=A0ABW3Z908_9HYPH
MGVFGDREARAEARRPAATHPILAGLGPDGLARLRPFMRDERHDRGAVLADSRAPLRHVHFIVAGLVAVIARDTAGVGAEAGLVGPGGLIGVSAVLGAHPPFPRIAVAVTPGESLTVEIKAMENALATALALRQSVMAYAGTRINQSARICACAALHSVEQRLARWLLEAFDLAGPGALLVTHAQLSDLLGVRRASVTAGLQMLERDGAIACGRGRVELRDVSRLAARSCGCQPHASA